MLLVPFLDHHHHEVYKMFYEDLYDKHLVQTYQVLQFLLRHLNWHHPYKLVHHAYEQVRKYLLSFLQIPRALMDK